MHLHHLLLGDLLVQFVRNRDRQQQSGSGDVADGAEHVGHHSQQTDERAADHGDLRDVALHDLFDDLWVPAEAGDLHPRTLDLFGGRLRPHAGGFDPEHREDRPADQHERQVDRNAEADLPRLDPRRCQSEEPHPVLSGLDRSQIVEQPVDGLAVGVDAEQCRHPGLAELAVEDLAEELDVRLQGPHEDHRQDAGVDELHREPAPGTPNAGVAQRDLDADRLGVDDHTEDQQRRHQCQQITRREQQVLEPLGGERRPEGRLAEEDPVPAGEKARGAEPRPADHAADELLAHAGDNEQPDTGADAPLAHDLVHEQDQDAADEHLREDHQLDAGDADPEGVTDRLAGRQEVPGKHHRRGSRDGHDDDQQLLEPLIEHLIARVVFRIQPQ